MKLREIISSENDYTAHLGQRTCQQYLFITISDYRKGAILEKRSRVKNAIKKKTGVFFSRAATFNFN